MTEPQTFSFGQSSDPAPKSATPAKRQPGRPRASAKKEASVEDALATMNSMYKLLSMGAMMIRRPLTAAHIAGSMEEWEKGNRQAFESSPRLAAAIAGVGQTSGVVTFLVTNGVAAFGIVSALRQESAIVAEEKAKNSEPETVNAS